MSRRVENECVGCPTEMGCLGSSCPNRNVLYISCDECGEDLFEDEVYEFDGNDYCEKCAKKLYPDEFESEEDE